MSECACVLVCVFDFSFCVQIRFNGIPDACKAIFIRHVHTAHENDADVDDDVMLLMMTTLMLLALRLHCPIHYYHPT